MQTKRASCSGMARPCCAKDCSAEAVIREPLELDGLTLHVALCREHDDDWKAFAAKRDDALRKLAKDAHLAGWAFDAALAYATIPPDHHL